MGFREFLNETKKMSMKRIKTSINSIYELSPKSLKVEDGVLEFVENFSGGIGAEEKADEMLKNISALLGKLGFEESQKLPKFAKADQTQEVQNVFISPKKDVLITNVFEDKGSEGFLVFTYVYDINILAKKSSEVKKEVEKL